MCGFLRARTNTEYALGVFLRVKIEKCGSESKQLVLSKARGANNAELEVTPAPARRRTSKTPLTVARFEIEGSDFGLRPFLVACPFACLALELPPESAQFRQGNRRTLLFGIPEIRDPYFYRWSCAETICQNFRRSESSLKIGRFLAMRTAARGDASAQLKRYLAQFSLRGRPIFEDSTLPQYFSVT